jgi:segregation and condensation protein A
LTEDLKISLPHYEGPLDLLLDMIRKQKIDIYDIPSRGSPSNTSSICM